MNQKSPDKSFGVPRGWLSLHPGPGQEPWVLRWTSPFDGEIRAEGVFLPGDGGVMQVAVRMNTQTVWSASNAGSFALRTNVAVGDVLDFTVYGGYSQGNTPLRVRITTNLTWQADPGTFDPTEEFSVDSGNPNGAWSYGWMQVGFGPLNLLTNKGYVDWNPMWYGWHSDRSPLMWVNYWSADGAYGAPRGWLTLHPGPQKQPCVLRWTAPFNAEIRTEGVFLPGDSGTMQVAVRMNTQTVWSASNAGSFVLQTNVVAGDILDFTVYGGYDYGNTPLRVRITTNLTQQVRTRCVGTGVAALFNVIRGGTQYFERAEVLSALNQWTVVLATNMLLGQTCVLKDPATNRVMFYRVRWP